MAQITVNFTFHSGVKRQPISECPAVRKLGCSRANSPISGRKSPMAASQDETGCDAFNASVSFDAAETGTFFQWGVIADIAGAPNTWVVVTEVPDENSNQRFRSFTLAAGATQQDYWFVTGRRFGAQKWAPSGSASHGPPIRGVGAACSKGRSGFRAVRPDDRHADRLYL